ncbi:hypothetical protein HY495_02760 [Candidatus Woesearchaeota archaeon]|nr:hypothetical protein [Candidatus Woesearchaeota archaeon]
MSLTDQNWWRKLFKPEPEQREDVSKDITAIIDFLQDAVKTPQLLLPEVKKLEELERESHVAKSGLLQTNLETQAEILEKILALYESLQNDADINGIRVKRIAEGLLHRAQRTGLKELVERKRKDPRWQGKW